MKKGMGGTFSQACGTAVYNRGSYASLVKFNLEKNCSSILLKLEVELNWKRAKRHQTGLCLQSMQQVNFNILGNVLCASQEELRSAGYECSGSHAEPRSIKTLAPLQEVQAAVLRATAKVGFPKPIFI